MERGRGREDALKADGNGRVSRLGWWERREDELRMAKLTSHGNGRMKKGGGIERAQGRERRGRRQSRYERGETSERVGWERNEKGQ